MNVFTQTYSAVTASRLSDEMTTRWNSEWIKRCIDVVGASVLLALTAPLLCISAVAIWLTMGAPVIFRQERAGYRGRLFTIYKFRTMRDELDESGRRLLPSERLTHLGRVLRLLNVDELPQLWNILKGDMSLVGPRPLLGVYLSRYNERQAKRHEMKPGVTGYAQVIGRHALTWEEKFALDVWYVGHWSLQLDLKILLMTVWAIITAKNSDGAASPSEPEFLGTPSGNASVSVETAARAFGAAAPKQ